MSSTVFVSPGALASAAARSTVFVTDGRDVFLIPREPLLYDDKTRSGLVSFATVWETDNSFTVLPRVAVPSEKTPLTSLSRTEVRSIFPAFLRHARVSAHYKDYLRISRTRDVYLRRGDQQVIYLPAGSALGESWEESLNRPAEVGVVAFVPADDVPNTNKIHSPVVFADEIDHLPEISMDAARREHPALFEYVRAIEAEEPTWVDELVRPHVVRAQGSPRL